MQFDEQKLKYSIIIIILIAIFYKKQYIDIDKSLYTKKNYKLKLLKIRNKQSLSHKIIDSCNSGFLAGAVAGGLTGGIPGSITGSCVYAVSSGLTTYINHDYDEYDSDSDSDSGSGSDSS
jgi:hypothetical protein